GIAQRVSSVGSTARKIFRTSCLAVTCWRSVGSIAFLPPLDHEGLDALEAQFGRINCARPFASGATRKRTPLSQYLLRFETKTAHEIRAKGGENLRNILRADSDREHSISHGDLAGRQRFWPGS